MRKARLWSLASEIRGLPILKEEHVQQWTTAVIVYFRGIQQRAFSY